MIARICNSGLALFCLGHAGPATATTPVPVQCSASGTKSFVPAITAPAACAHFVRALGAATGTRTSLNIAPPRDGLIVELRFGSRGMASVQVVQFRAGRPQSLPVYELAISDRPFRGSDIDSLASDVARGLSADVPGKGKR
jgi:hypothetical protein